MCVYVLCVNTSACCIGHSVCVHEREHSCVWVNLLQCTCGVNYFNCNRPQANRACAGTASTTLKPHISRTLQGRELILVAVIGGSGLPEVSHV